MPHKSENLQKPAAKNGVSIRLDQSVLEYQGFMFYAVKFVFEIVNFLYKIVECSRLFSKYLILTHLEKYRKTHWTLLH